jgi:hypothetical protein
MEKRSGRDFTRGYFKPLKSFQYNENFHPRVATNKQLVLASNLHRSYGIPEMNILRLIMYAEIALHWAKERQIKLYYPDFSEIMDFEKNPAPVEKIVFMGSSKSFEVNNPYLIDKLHNSLLELIDFRKIAEGKPARKRHVSARIIKKVATELYNELTKKEKITGLKPLHIIGYIFSLYSIGLKNDDPILTEKEFNSQAESIKSKGKKAYESYLQYLSGTIKRYINWKSAE